MGNRRSKAPEDTAECPARGFAGGFVEPGRKDVVAGCAVEISRFALAVLAGHAAQRHAGIIWMLAMGSHISMFPSDSLCGAPVFSQPVFYADR